VGIGLLTIFGLLYEALPQQSYALDHVGHLGNALAIAYAILRYQLLDARVVVRRGLVYTGITVCVTAAYLIVLYGLQQFLHSWTAPANLAAIIVMTILLAWAFNPLREAIQRGTDRVFYGQRYDYRQLLSNFSQRMSNVLDLESYEAMLAPMTKAAWAKPASCFPEMSFQFPIACRLVQRACCTDYLTQRQSNYTACQRSKPPSRDIIDNSQSSGIWLTGEP
jgi:hypothetical protein